MNIPDTGNIKWSENVIVADADYIDKVAFDLTVNFERMIGRRIPPADMSQWAVCVALDGGLRPGKHETQVVLIHDRKIPKMENFVPGTYATELDGQAFDDPQMGEFTFADVATGEFAGNDATMLDVLRNLLGHSEVKRIVLIPDETNGELIETLRNTLRDANDEQRITLLAMQPLVGGNYRQEILGYSLMRALGIDSNEIK